MAASTPAPALRTRAEQHAASIRRTFDHPYTVNHALRFGAALAVIESIAERRGTPARVLDIGRSDFSIALATTLGVPVDNLEIQVVDPGAPVEWVDGMSSTGRVFTFDLNLAGMRHHWRTDLPRWDLIVCNEVVEHLYTPTRLVLRFLGSLLESGGTIVIGTPNAVSLAKRVRLLAGQNPYESLRAERNNPGHIRELTASELTEEIEAAGLRPETLLAWEYMPSAVAAGDGRRATVARRLERLRHARGELVPRSLRTGLLAVATNR